MPERAILPVQVFVSETRKKEQETKEEQNPQESCHFEVISPLSIS